MVRLTTRSNGYDIFGIDLLYNMAIESTEQGELVKYKPRFRIQTKIYKTMLISMAAFECSGSLQISETRFKFHAEYL